MVWISRIRRTKSFDDRWEYTWRRKEWKIYGTWKRKDIEDDAESLELGRLYRGVDEDLEDFAGEQSGLATTAEYIGKGIGGYALSVAITKSFEKNIKRVWLHTCTLDHPNALKNYKDVVLKFVDGKAKVKITSYEEK